MIELLASVHRKQVQKCKIQQDSCFSSFSPIHSLISFICLITHNQSSETQRSKTPGPSLKVFLYNLTLPLSSSGLLALHYHVSTGNSHSVSLTWTSILNSPALHLAAHATASLKSTTVIFNLMCSRLLAFDSLFLVPLSSPSC